MFPSSEADTCQHSPSKCSRSAQTKTQSGEQRKDKRKRENNKQKQNSKTNKTDETKEQKRARRRRGQGKRDPSRTYPAEMVQNARIKTDALVLLLTTELR